MPGRAVADLTAIRREAAMVRTLLEELEQLTGSAAEHHVGDQLAEALVILARKLVDVSTAMGCSWGIEPSREKSLPAVRR
jgi:hypothetical protein